MLEFGFVTRCIERVGEEMPMKRTKSGGTPSRIRDRPSQAERLETGQKIRDVRQSRHGIVLDFACQYSHPKAQPVYSYLIRWEDGQVQAISEGALAPGCGMEPVD